LAKARQQDVMAHWAGLGYYARARNLHRCAQTVVEQFNGVFPSQASTLVTLPGVGPSTAAAIAAFSYGERVSILDGNVKRVLARYQAIHGDPGKKDIERQLWQIATALLPSESTLKKDPHAMASHTQGLMDLGAMICTRGKPKCVSCPVQPSCLAHAQGLTEALPTPRVRKAIPDREATMLIVEHDQHLVLEQRPQKGIWGGLWSLPETHPGWMPRQHPDWKSNVPHPVVISKLAGFRHVFTHFRLHVQPYVLTFSGSSRPDLSWLGDISVMRWVPLKQLEGYGLPKPVKTLLAGWLERSDME
jgi:A/G-specific adenine glycosylase